MRICVANLLLFISLYVLFPVLSVEMADRLGVPAAQTGVIFLFFTLGMFLIGPFHAYLVDAYKRKYALPKSVPWPRSFGRRCMLPGPKHGCIPLRTACRAC